jgi:hypothetical protein
MNLPDKVDLSETLNEGLTKPRPIEEVLPDLVVAVNQLIEYLEMEEKLR